MKVSLRLATGLSLFPAICFSLPAAVQAQAFPSVRHVQVLRGGGQVEIEIESSDRLVPQTNLLSNPDRLVVDFVNAVPGAQLRGQSVHRSEVKSLRVGLFSSNPPVTRIVVDLNGAQPYEVFPSGRTVIVKVGGGAGEESAASSPASGAMLVNANYPAHAVPISAAPAAKPPLEVLFQNGLLSISSRKANLSEVLFAVHQRTGAEIAIPAGAEQEQVAVELGPAPASEVLAHLLNGSKFNFLILNSSTDSRALDRVILTPRAEGPMPMARPQPQRLAEERVAEENDENVQPPPQVRTVSPGSSADGPTPPASAPETKPTDPDIPN